MESVAWVLRSDPELGVQDSTPALPKGDKALTSEVRGLPVSVKTLKLLLFSQDAKEFFHPLVSLPQTKRYLRDTHNPGSKITGSDQQRSKGTS